MLMGLWLWAWLWYGDVLRMAREYAFWSWEPVLMGHKDGVAWGELWRIGLCLLQLCRWPVLGGLLLSFMLTAVAWLLMQCLRLKGWAQPLAYIPSLCFTSWVAYVGLDLHFEAEPGRLFGLPFLALAVLFVTWIIIRSFRGRIIEARGLVAHYVCVGAVVVAPLCITHWMRPYVRLVTHMQVLEMDQRWGDAADAARREGELSYRTIAAYYAIALIQRGEIGSRLFDIRMDYDDPYMHGFDGQVQAQSNYYVMDMDFHNGLTQVATHHAVEHMVMNGPTLKSIKMLAKCALLLGDWRVAQKYFSILHHTPFEGDFIAKYEPMIGDTAAINADPEFRIIRLLEPTRDTFENYFEQPVFLGYNAALMEGRSINALWNSLAVHAYTKSMPQFIFRCQPLAGTQPPEQFTQAIALMAGKQPELLQAFPNMQFERQRVEAFAASIQPYMNSRQEHAKELYPRWKGYYPYYYFFGNLKATKPGAKPPVPNAGVN